MEHLIPGRRISLGPHRGTIRFRGAVPPSSGEWLGIEWDDPTRGKHSGTSADGTRYFSVRISGSGSFIRPTASKLSGGCSFLVALRNKYSPPMEETREEQGEKQAYSRKNIADIEIEAPNLDRIAKRTARLDRLKEVGLGGWNQSHTPGVDADSGHDPSFDVARAYDDNFGPGSIRKTCPYLRWLDLSRSLLPDWEEVSLIAGELQQLKSLLLHFNRLQTPPKDLPSSWLERLGSIQDLGLDGTLTPWEDVARLAPALPLLRHLQLGSNQIADLMSEVEGSILPSLTSLSLEDNHLDSWPNLVSALSRLPSLESLNLNFNCIKSVPTVSPASAKLPKLKELHLRSNQMDSWTSLENIATWLGHGSGLEALHISTVHDDDEAEPSVISAHGDLLTRYEYRDFRAILIARLPDLRILDKTDITAKERKDAELFVYTRFREGDASIIYGATTQSNEEKAELTLEQKVALFPRYMELAKLYDCDEGSILGAQRAQKEVEKKSNTLRSKVINLTVIASSTAPDAKSPHVVEKSAEAEVKILASTPLRLAKIKMGNAVGVKVAEIEGIWALLRQSDECAREGDGGERIVLEIDDLSRGLDWYEVSNGDLLVLVTNS